MKISLKIAFLLFLPIITNAQQNNPDSLRTIFQTATTDSARHNASFNLYLCYIEAKRDSALFYAEQRLTFAKKNNFKLAEASALISKAYQYNAMGKYSEAYLNLLQALKIAEDPKNEEVQGWKVTQYPIPNKSRLIVLATIHHVLGGLMRNAENPEQEIIQLKEALRIAVQINHPDRQMTANMNLASLYLKMNQTDSAFYFAKASQILSKNPLARGYIGNNMLTLGDIFLAKGNVAQAKDYYYEGLRSSMEQNNQSDIANINHRLLIVYHQENKKDSALYYAVKNLNVINAIEGVGYREINIGVAYEDLYLAYHLNNQPDSAYKYQGLALVTKDSLYKIRIRNLADFQKLSLGETLRLENLEKEKIQTQNKIRIYAMLGGLVVFTIIAFILYRNNLQKQAANKMLESTLADLKATQSQLIQSEKMASLGELTAGIAHEIQNPLNFVNNFSEVNMELIEELKGERQKVEPARNKDLENELLNDIKENERKINHHGKRADAIVKGMLQHSRSSISVKEPTDINALCDEYLRLSYHGLRATDNSFNATLKTDFDQTIGNINIIPQDIGRVLLNLYNNAFYAVNERKKMATGKYEPTVTISTSSTSSPSRGRGVLIKVSDNGGGISPAIVDKIFQPFFTTKPTGQGTGLGLSLSYDIIKAHGGEIRIKTKEGEGSEFIIQLPHS